MGQWQLPTDMFQAKNSGLLKELFQSILKIEVENMLHLLGDQEKTTLKQCLNQVCHHKKFICTWNKTNIQKTEQATMRT